jgi:hypothetical protein
MVDPHQLQMDGKKRDLAMFNLAIDSKLRGCDVVKIKVETSPSWTWFHWRRLAVKPTALSLSDSASLGIASLPSFFGGGDPTDEKEWKNVWGNVWGTANSIPRISLMFNDIQMHEEVGDPKVTKVRTGK